jgi:putative oxygen-independent coproporphyrinogen III oxidase
LYFGGGTPSQADPAEIARILAAIAPAPDAEITAEINPGKLDAGRLAELASAGINRVSLGVQSFQPDVARRLGRAHSCKEADEVYRLARTLGFRSISLDLIFGVPGQTLADFDDDLDHIAACPPDHVSLYGLTIEPGTPFHRAGYGKKSAEIEDADDELWRRMYDRATERLSTMGIHVYEVSNFAASGHRSRHNEHYWRARSWAGLGASAHGCRPSFAPDGSRQRVCRTHTASEVDAYIADPMPVLDHVDIDSLFAELVGSTLRHIDGVDLESLFQRTGFRIAPPPALVRAGTLSVDHGMLKLHPRDLPVVDFVAARLCEARYVPEHGAAEVLTQDHETADASCTIHESFFTPSGT